MLWLSIAFGRFDWFFGFLPLPGALAFPCFVSGLLVLPLCGAAPTFLCLPQRKVGKRKRLTPLILKRVSRAAAPVVHLESAPSHTPPS
jgi:hypothetical protein